jgi:hypothetical protein
LTGPLRPAGIQYWATGFVTKSPGHRYHRGNAD